MDTRVRFDRWVSVGLIVVVLLAGIAYEVLSDSMTMTTSYPSPVGVYKRLTSTAQTLLARDGGNVGIGTGAQDPKVKLDVKGEIKVGNSGVLCESGL